MSDTPKLRGGSDSELTKLKALWRGLPPDARAFWQELFVSPEQTQTQIRALILARLKINLRFDKQLNQFRGWESVQFQMDQEAEQAAEEERRLMAEHPDWTKEQVREDLLRRVYLRSRATGDARLGLKAIAADVKMETLRFDQEKFKEGLRSKLETGLAELAKFIKGNAKAQAAYEAFKQEVKLATK